MNCPGFTEPRVRGALPGRQMSCLAWTAFLQGKRGHACLSHLTLCPTHCRVSFDRNEGVILYLLPGNPEPAWSATSASPSISGLLQSPCIQQPGMTRLLAAWAPSSHNESHPTMKGCEIPRGGSGIGNALQNHLSFGKGSISRGLSGMACGSA